MSGEFSIVETKCSFVEDYFNVFADLIIDEVVKEEVGYENYLDIDDKNKEEIFRRCAEHYEKVLVELLRKLKEVAEKYSLFRSGDICFMEFYERFAEFEQEVLDIIESKKGD